MSLALAAVQEPAPSSAGKETARQRAAKSASPSLALAAQKEAEKQRGQQRGKALVALLWRSILIGVLVGLLAAAVYSLTSWIATSQVNYRGVLAASIGSAFLTFALTFAINAVGIFQRT